MVAPAGGTARDVQSLSRELGLPAEAVSAVMNSGGRGYNRRTSAESAAAASSEGGVGASGGTEAVAGASAWSDFMSEEMPSASASASASRARSEEGAAQVSDAPSAKRSRTSTSPSPPSASASTDAADPRDAPAPPAAEADESAPRDYDLPIRPRMAIPDGYNDDGDRGDEKGEGGRGGLDRPPAPGRLAQTGTLDPSVAGRTKRPLSADVSHDLAEPTLLVPAPEGPPQPSIPRGLPFGGIKIALVATSSTSCHSVAVDVSGRAYGWGRNECSQLGSLSSSASSLSEGGVVEGESTNNNTMIPLPRLLAGPFVTDSIPIVGAATGKGHTILIDARGAAYACGSNKLGQCGINHMVQPIPLRYRWGLRPVRLSFFVSFHFVLVPFSFRFVSVSFCPFNCRCMYIRVMGERERDRGGAGGEG